MRVHGTVNLAALRHNIGVVRRLAPYANRMAVVKANAYGHGAVRVAKALEPHVHGFGVATVDEAVDLRESGLAAPICVLSGFSESSHVSVLADFGLDAAVYCDDQIKILGSCRSQSPITAWLKINTGMNRLGFAPERVAPAVSKLLGLPGVGRIRLMSHFASADQRDSDSAPRQLELFLQVARKFEFERTIANSAALIRMPESCLEWVRPGIMLYGASPFANTAAAELDLRPAMDLFAPIIAINRVRQGDAVGYGGEWVSPGDARIGIVACGYGDGYPRSASHGGSVLIDDRRVSIVGTISMDTLAVDLSRHPDVAVGTRVKLFGEGLPIDEIARAAGTIPYELLTSIAGRSPVTESTG